MYLKKEPETMFTGLIEEIGTISSIRSLGNEQLELTVNAKTIQASMKLGDSVAVNGVCLTVIAFDDAKVSFELSPETLRSTLFGDSAASKEVNLERATRVGDRLGGHIVQGHVDAMAKLIQVKEIGSFFEMDFTVDPAVAKYIVQKGSIAINGISLTIADLKSDYFRIAVIPLTYKETILSNLKVGDQVHIETDILARYVERLLQFDEKEKKNPGITQDFLKNHGF